LNGKKDEFKLFWPKSKSHLNRTATLHFFTPYYGSQNVLLAHTEYWVNEFSKYFDNVKVYAVHVEPEKSASEGVSIYEIGGGTVFRRVIAVRRLISVSAQILLDRRTPFIFYHMLPEPSLILGPLLRLRKGKQLLWYAHSKHKWVLPIAETLVDIVVTPTATSFPIKSKKIIVVGHAIPSQGNELQKDFATSKRSREVLFVGRISAIKRLEKVMWAMSHSDCTVKRFVLVGPILDSNYMVNLKELAKNLEIEMDFRPEVPLELIHTVMSGSSFFFSGSPKSLDKASAQAAIYGCFVLSEEEKILDATGMNSIWSELGFSEAPSLVNQITILNSLDKKMETRFRSKIMNSAFSMNRLDKTIEKIANLFRSR